MKTLIAAALATTSLVGAASAQEISGDQSPSEDQQDRGYCRVCKSTDLRQQRGDVGEQGEDACKPQDRGQEAEKDGGA